MRTSVLHKVVMTGALTLLAVFPLRADGGIRIVDPVFVRESGLMQVAMGIEFPALKLKSSGATVLTPMIVNGIDTLRLPSVSVYGRTSWYMSHRNDRVPLGGNEGRVMLYDKPLPSVEYTQKVRYADWMNGAELIVERADYGCAGCREDRRTSELGRYRQVEYTPVFIYQAAVVEAVKTRELSGRANVDFPVNRTEIFPSYRRNSVELAKIIATIDSVKNDKDITVTSIAIKGFASPEGSYENNTRLARGRTAALKQYVRTLYHFPADFITTDYEPEDWEGLRAYVAESFLEYRDEILAIIDDPLLHPDIKDKRIQARYGSDYRFLLSEVYPGLRHSDYRIEYMIRSFSDPAEIREVLRTQPQKLSLNEIYLAAQGLEPGSEAYNEVFETAVRMFPAEPVANLNAANAAMQRGDLVGATRYLERAGEGPEAVYARGVLAALNKDFETGIRLVERAVAAGLPDNQGILEHLREAARYN